MREGDNTLRECPSVALLHEWGLVVPNQNDFRIFKT